MNALQKAKDLVRLASDERTPKEEALVAAFQACKLIDKHELLDSDPLRGFINDVPEDIRETVDAAASIYKGLTDPAFVGSVKKVAKTIMRGRRRRRYE